MHRALAALIGYKVVFGANGTIEWRAKRQEYQHLQEQISKANEQHVQLENRVKKLQSDPNTIIKEAREKLGYVMPGEVVLVRPNPRPMFATSRSRTQLFPLPRHEAADNYSSLSPASLPVPVQKKYRTLTRLP